MKFNVGDKVRIVNGPACPGVDSITINERKKYFNKVVTIAHSYNDGYYRIEEDSCRFIWHGHWLKPVKDGIITISFFAKTKEEAMENAKKEIEKLFQPDDWTNKEIVMAKEEVVRLVTKVTEEGGDVSFSKSGNCIMCDFYKDSFTMQRRSKFSTPKGQDIFNPWIGKCVALCKVLKEPIPSFILNKNK